MSFFFWIFERKDMEMENISAEELSRLQKEFLYELNFGGVIEGTREEREAICCGRRTPLFRSGLSRSSSGRAGRKGKGYGT